MLPYGYICVIETILVSTVVSFHNDEVQNGLLVRLLVDYANVPAGTLAAVDSTGRCTTAPDG